MDRTVTVQGVGKLSLSPDTIEVSIDLSSKDKVYSAAMEQASKRVGRLTEALLKLGFDKGDLKTGWFNVRTDYEGYHDEKGNYRQVFAGYVFEQHMTLRFPYDTEKLAQALAAFSECDSEPNLNIGFTVKDKDAAIDALLKAAAADAQRRAWVLAKAAGARLGSIVSVSHNVQTPVFYSPTRMNVAAKMACFEETGMDMSVSPESIELTENATFVWALE